MNTIDKLAWVHIKDKKVLYVRSKHKDTFFNPGGKRKEGESDEQALVREVKEELNVALMPETIRFMETFTAQAYGKPEGVSVEMKCYAGDYMGTLTPTSEIEELAWFTSTDMERTTPTGQLALAWFKKHNLID